MLDTTIDMKQRKFYWLGGLIVVILGLLLMINIGDRTVNTPNQKILVVAAENFWGSLVGQLGGSKIGLTTIVSDPNADPHEYETNTTAARAVANADYVILNGAGYDSWGEKLISASPRSGRKLLNVAVLLGKKEGDNPHFWYSPTYVDRVIKQMDADLISLSPGNRTYFNDRYNQLLSSLAAYKQTINAIKSRFAGTKVAATEDIFTYMASATGLDLISPPAFTEAVAEGNDPPANSIVVFQQQLSSGQVKLLVYNKQTVTPLTSSIKQLSVNDHVPVVAVTETIQPPNATFQAWMNSQLLNIKKALSADITVR